MTDDWEPISTAPEGIEVRTKVDDAKGIRNVQTLVKDGSLWFYPDHSMYVYYAPTHWQYIEEPEMAAARSN